ncbi:ADP-ribosylation factor-binding protein GGA3 [Taenia crassiceps]|uniref:ADP-ribosylation factor-binding protein GGA3 n=1 Tax=Taenia crassiceps TaxID=6207 RepID=A0ABR4Q0D5_9CEST
MVSNTESLENMITEVTSPLTTHIDLNAFKRIYDRINGDPHGPEVALRLLAHKIQSPQEKEALSALVILDLCVQNCGPNFHKELGKFKFLNELMKILLPKHLGDFTPPIVRDKCIMLMFAWQRDLGDTYPKLREAYHALKAQNIVTVDPVVPNEAECDEQYNHQIASRADIFKSSRYKDKLDRLLKSKNPEDLREANAIIKNIVNEEDARIAKRSRRALQLETLRNNANLLEEMLRCIGPNMEPSASDLDVMEEISLNIKQARPVVFELALSDGDREEGFLTDVIETCSRASSVLERYEVVVLHKPPSTVDDPAAVVAQRGPPPPKPPTASQTSPETSENLLTLSPAPHQDLLSQDLLNLGIHHDPPHLPTQQTKSSSDMNLLVDLLCDASKAPANPPVLSSLSASSTTVASPLPTSQLLPPIPMQSTNSSSPKLVANTTTSSKSTPTTSVANVFSELDKMGRQMLSLTTVLPISDTTASEPSTQLHPLRTEETNTTDLPSLSSLPALTFSAIRPHFQHTQPIQVFPLNSNDGGEEGELKQQHQMVEVVLHCTANKPHPSVSVLVAVVTNRSALPLTNLLLRFGVEKPLKVRQLSLSTSSLPAFCSFLPPSPAQQIIYIQRPPTLEVKTAKLKFQLSFTLDEEDVLESGTVSVTMD